jgi:hypothetical protein
VVYMRKAVVEVWGVCVCRVSYLHTIMPTAQNAGNTYHTSPSSHQYFSLHSLVHTYETIIIINNLYSYVTNMSNAVYKHEPT